MKKQYLKATVDVIEFRAEKGFAGSATTQKFDNGGSFNWDATGSGAGNDGSGDGFNTDWDF